MRWPVAVPVLGLLVLGTAACTGETPGAASGTTTSTTAPASPEASQSDAPAATTAVPTAQARVVDAELYEFRSPTGNIGCSMARADAVCEIKDATFQQPAKPSDCDLDYGEMIGISGEARAEFSCHGDTVFGVDHPVLPYGERVTNGSVTCASATSGVTCSTASGSHGFELSRAAYRLY